MAEIPVYKERIIYGIKNGEEASYKIKDSYAGILRLSPNNSATLIESNNLASSNEEISRYVNYEDNVAYDLSKQFVRVSTSDGVLLDLRLSKNAVEYDNLYIQGAAKTDNGVICHLGKNDGFFINNNSLPTTYNSANVSDLNNADSQYVPLKRDQLKDGYILVNMAETGKTPVFEYINAYDIINNFVSDTLLKMTALPTGSIHWFPISIKSYESLLKKSNNRHNGDDLESDSIIRDFLLCDGSQYKVEDFPELAKVLKGEKINFWSTEVVGDNIFMKRNYQDDSFNKKEGTFRVPDLRSMFIQYVVPTIDKVGAKNNIVGDYEIDSNINPKIDIDALSDKHYHYIVLDNSFVNNHNTKWDSKLYSPTVTSGKMPATVTFQAAINGNDQLGRPKFNPSGGRPLVRYGSMRPSTKGPLHKGTGACGCDKRACNWYGVGASADQKKPPSWIYAPTFSSKHCTIGGDTCGYILSNSYDASYQLKKDSKVSLNNYIGLSSWDVDMSITNSNKSEKSFNKINYTSGDTTVYKKEKKYVEYNDAEYEMVGKENTPEFFACLPLIKI